MVFVTEVDNPVLADSLFKGQNDCWILLSSQSSTCPIQPHDRWNRATKRRSTVQICSSGTPAFRRGPIRRPKSDLSRISVSGQWPSCEAKFMDQDPESVHFNMLGTSGASASARTRGAFELARRGARCLPLRAVFGCAVSSAARLSRSRMTWRC